MAAGKKIAELEREIAQLRSRLKHLQEHIEALSRVGKRQAAPFSRGLPKSDPSDLL